MINLRVQVQAMAGMADALAAPRSAATQRLYDEEIIT